MNIETGTIVSIVLGIIVTIIGAYCKSLVKSLEDVKQNFEDYKKEDTAIEKLQDERILTVQNRQEQKMIRLDKIDAVIIGFEELEKKQDNKILTLENKQNNGLQKLNELENTLKSDRKELSDKITFLSDAIIMLTSTIKHLEEKISDLKLTNPK